MCSTWASQITSGMATKGTLIQSMLDSAHTFNGHSTWGWVPQLLNNKYTVGHYFAVQQGVNYATPENSIQRTMEIAAAVTSQGIADAIARMPLSAGTPPIDPATPPPAPPTETPSGGRPNPPPEQAPFSAAVVTAPADGATIANTIRLEVRGNGMENVELVPASGYTPIYGVFSVSNDKTYAWLDLDPQSLPEGSLAMRILAWNASARSVNAQEIAAMPARNWIIQPVPEVLFAAELSQAPASGETIQGEIMMEVRGSGIENVELLPESGYSPILARFNISPDKTVASLNFDTRHLPNRRLRARISAFNTPPGNPGSTEIVVMPPRDWFLQN